MADSVLHLKKRIKSIGNINKITKAMELVAATKMRKSQEIALASRPYAFTALDLLINLVKIEQSKGLQMPELLQERPTKKTLFVLMASDKGLAGAFNSILFKKFESVFSQTPSDAENIFIAVGQKAFQYLESKKVEIAGKFTSAEGISDPLQAHPVANSIIDGYIKGRWDQVIVCSAHFVSALKQEPVVRHILPVNALRIQTLIDEIVPKTGKFSDIIKEREVQGSVFEKQSTEYVVEPSPEYVLDNLARHLIFLQIYHLILEANASEHSARRLAMKTASDNAADLGEKLNLYYNKSRQAGITNQIIEISAGVEAQG